MVCGSDRTAKRVFFVHFTYEYIFFTLRCTKLNQCFCIDHSKQAVQYGVHDNWQKRTWFIKFDIVIRRRRLYEKSKMDAALHNAVDRDGHAIPVK